MSAPVPAVDWLMSAYDATWHAFPTAQVSDQTRTFYQALREHSVPIGTWNAPHRALSAPPAWCSTAPTSPTTSAGRPTADPTAAQDPERTATDGGNP